MVLGVEFVRQHVNFVSDQFFIMAAVGLNAARVGAIIAPEKVETKVASMFVQKFQSNSAAVGTGAAFAPLAPHQRLQRSSTNGTGHEAIQVDVQRQQENIHRPASITERGELPGSSPAPQSAIHQHLPRVPERTVVDSSSSHIELPTEEPEKRERTRIEGTGRIRRQ